MTWEKPQKCQETWKDVLTSPSYVCLLADPAQADTAFLNPELSAQRSQCKMYWESHLTPFCFLQEEEKTVKLVLQLYVDDLDNILCGTTLKFIWQQR